MEVILSNSLPESGLTFQLDNSDDQRGKPGDSGLFPECADARKQQNFSSGNGSFGDYNTRKLIPSYNYSTVDNPYYPTTWQGGVLTFEYNGGVARR